MKITVSREELTGALALVSRVAVSRSPQAILQGVKFSAGPAGLELRATDLDIGITYVHSPSHCEGSEEFVLLPERLSSALREIGDSDVTLYTDASDLVLQHGDGMFKFRRMDADDFPNLPAFPEAGTHRFKAAPLAQMLSRTVFCSGREKGRYAINGVYITIGDGLFEMAATDGKRLSACSLNLEGAKDIQGLVLPVKLAEILNKEISGLAPDAPVDMFTDGRQVSFKFADVVLSGRLVEGEYPAYRSVIPKNNDKIAVVDRDEFTRICRASMIFTDIANKAVGFTFDTDSLTVHSRLQELGEAKLKIAVRYTGDPVTLGFNPQYLMDYLKAVQPGDINFQFTSGTRAALLTQDEDPYGFQHVLMPVTLRD